MAEILDLVLGAAVWWNNKM